MTTNPDRQSVLNEDEEYRRFLDPNRYAEMNERVREKASNKKSLFVIAISCLVALCVRGIYGVPVQQRPHGGGCCDVP